MIFNEQTNILGVFAVMLDRVSQLIATAALNLKRCVFTAPQDNFAPNRSPTWRYRASKPLHVFIRFYQAI